jgi:hypothetical protein
MEDHPRQRLPSSAAGAQRLDAAATAGRPDQAFGPKLSGRLQISRSSSGADGETPACPIADSARPADLSV